MRSGWYGEGWCAPLRGQEDAPRLTFDPGKNGLDDLDLDHLDVLELVSECFKVQYPGHCGKCPVITDGVVQLVDSSVDIENVLFDSGALQASYISKWWMR